MSRPLLVSMMLHLHPSYCSGNFAGVWLGSQCHLHNIATTRRCACIQTLSDPK
jgi:hypothetical protein